MAFICDKGRRIYHGDLAARNVLLTDKKVAKVSDFGLAKCLVGTDSQCFEQGVRLPIRWMAPELMATLEGNVFSYAVVLWEIFTLGETPYPGMK